MTDQIPNTVWAIVRVDDHRRYAGRVTGVKISGSGFIRIYIPQTNHCHEFVRFIPIRLIRDITPVSVTVAGEAAEQFGNMPIDVVTKFKATLEMD